MEFQTFLALSGSAVGIALIVSVIMVILRRFNVFPPSTPIWQNVSVVVLSIVVAVIGYWLSLPLNVTGFIEAVWMGLFAAAVQTWGFEGIKSLRKSI